MLKAVEFVAPFLNTVDVNIEFGCKMGVGSTNRFVKQNITYHTDRCYSLPLFLFIHIFESQFEFLHRFNVLTHILFTILLFCHKRIPDKHRHSMGS